MTPTIEELGLSQLSPAVRLALAEALWESVAREKEAAPLTEAQRLELDCRVADSQARPNAVRSWDELKARALARARP